MPINVIIKGVVIYRNIDRYTYLEKRAVPKEVGKRIYVSFYFEETRRTLARVCGHERRVWSVSRIVSDEMACNALRDLFYFHIGEIFDAL